MKNRNKSTKFPVARIKKIMQKDEEVGKVAQATPVVISKALELFLSFIVTKAHEVTAERGARKVEPYHVKHAVETNDMLDFLKEIVEPIPDPSNGGTIDLEAEAADKRAKRGKGKRGAGAVASSSGAGDEAEDGEATTGEPAPKRRRKKKVVDPAAVPGAEGTAAAAAAAAAGPKKRAPRSRKKVPPPDAMAVDPDAGVKDDVHDDNDNDGDDHDEDDHEGPMLHRHQDRDEDMDEYDEDDHVEPQRPQLLQRNGSGSGSHGGRHRSPSEDEDDS